MSFYPEFKKCPLCYGEQYIVDDECILKCDYCRDGYIAVYSRGRSILSKMVLCHSKFQEPDDAKSKIIRGWLDPFKIEKKI